MASSWNPFDWLAESLANKLGSDLSSLRFLLTIFFGYPIAFVYLLCIRKQPPRTIHIYFVATGILLILWNYGFGVVHLFIGVASTLTTLHIFGPTVVSVAMTFVFNVTYLLFGYYYMNYGTYDINWTMSYCVLCLRLIGLAWDYRDGALQVVKLSEYQKSAAIKTLPGVLETLSFCLMPTACFVGPQFTWLHYKSFIEQTLRPQIVLDNRTLIQKYIRNPKLYRTVSRLLSGITFMALYVLSLKYFPMDHMLTEEFLNHASFLYRLGYICMYTQLLIMRYLAIWLIGEGACVLLGLGCTGRIRVDYADETADVASSNGGAELNPQEKEAAAEKARFRKAAVLSSVLASGFRPASDFDFQELQEAVAAGRATVTEAQHTRCANISVVRFQSATNTDLLVSSFNINTNKWMLEYMYKRLKFLGSKQLSQIVTLSFLALWHGFYSGYYVNFFLEFITIYVEKQFLPVVRRSVYSEFLYDTLGGKVLTTIVGKLHVIFLLGFPLVAFSMLRAEFWIPVFRSVYWIGFIYVLWPLAAPLAKKAFPPATVVAVKNGDSAQSDAAATAVDRPAVQES